MIIFLCALLLPFGQMHANEWYLSGENVELPFNHLYLDAYAYEGDEDLNFVGDPVAVLEDNSCWKIHPQHIETFGQWEVGANVHIGLRTEWYWFKREHKFLLVNHDRNEAIPVMLVRSPSLNIAKVSQPQPTQRRDMGWGPAFYTYFDYRRNLTLSDGSLWDIENNHENDFSVDSPVYIGYHTGKNGIALFLIGGIEKNGVWTWARKGNHTYTFWRNWHH